LLQILKSGLILENQRVCSFASLTSSEERGLMRGWFGSTPSSIEPNQL